MRKELQLSQKSFAQKINISQNHLSAIENGVRELTDRVAEDIIRTFSVNRDWLLNGTGSMFTDSLADLALDEEVRELAESYASLPLEQRQIIRDMLDALAKSK
ncbi:helix-turn-helix protein [compost metagenome]